MSIISASRVLSEPDRESILIRNAQSGDLDSFNALVLAYQNSIFNTALRILGNEELAADATQDAFISAFRNIATFRGGSYKAYLMRTVTNACYDELRRQKRRLITPLERENRDGDEMDSSDWLADPAMMPEKTVEANELEHAIQQCINELPIEFRAVIILADVEEMNYTEIASALGVPIGTVKSRLARARVRLRESLQDFGDLLPAAFREMSGTGTNVSCKYNGQ